MFTRSAATGLLHERTETAFYIASAPLIAARAAEAVRAHWMIETTSHHSRDVTLAEDRSRIRSNPGVFARLRSFAFNILKANKTASLPQDLRRSHICESICLEWRGGRISESMPGLCGSGSEMG